MKKYEAITDTDAKKPIKPSTVRKAAAAIVGVGVLVTGCSDNSAEKIAKPTPSEAIKNIPAKTDNGNVPGSINEPGEPDNPSIAPEIGSAAMVERATTPEQNAEFQMSATALATSVMDLYDQGIGTGNAMYEGEEAHGSRIIKVENVANDNSGSYILTAQLPDGSMNPDEVKSVTIAMYRGGVEDGHIINAAGFKGSDSVETLYSMYLDNSSGTGWELGSEVAPSIDVLGSVEPGSQQPQVDFARQVILRAADGAPVS